MTIGLQITDGVTTVDCNDGNYIELMELELGYGDVSQQLVAGRFRAYISGTNVQIQTELTNLQRLLQAATVDSGRGMGGALYNNLDRKIYINYRTDSSETYYRSRLTRAGYSLSLDTMTILNFDCGGIEIDIDFERYNWWEGPEYQLALSNHLATDALGDCPVYNPDIVYFATTISFVDAGGPIDEINDAANGLDRFKVGDTIRVEDSSSNDGTYTVVTSSPGQLTVTGGIVNEGAGGTVYIFGEYCDYCDIQGANIMGDLPAPIKLELTNTYNNVNSLSYVFIGHNYVNPSTLTWILQFEEATGKSPTASELYSHAAYLNYSLATGAETEIASWTLTSNEVEAAAGRYFRAFFTGGSGFLNIGNPRYRIKLEHGGVQIWEGQQFKAVTDDFIYDLGVVRIPPSLAGVVGVLATLDLKFYGYQATGGAISLPLDYLKLLPADGYFAVYCRDVDYNERLVIDGLADYLYMDDGTGAGIAPIATSIGAPIMLQPGRNQRLYFIQKLANAGTWDIGQTMGVKCYYRPRRLSPISSTDGYAIP